MRFLWVSLLMVAGTAAVLEAADPLPLLIIDGQNNHNWQAMTPVMKTDLEATGRFKVDVATTPDNKAAKEAWDPFRPDFAKYRVVLSNYNGQLWPEPVQRGLEKFVADGGGLVIIHAANNAFAEWPEWNRMIGLGCRGADYGDRLILDEKGTLTRILKDKGPGAGHGRKHAYPVDLRDLEHPVTKGMPKRWMHAEDELYHGQRGPAENMHVLATAYSDPSTGGTGDHEPMIWWIPYGKGRVFTTVLGHVGGNDVAAIRCLGFITVMNRGCEWAATGEVTLPIPEKFPNAYAVSAAP